MKKILPILLSLVCSASMAQSHFKAVPHVTASAEFGIPVSRFESVQAQGFGASAKFLYPIGNQFATLQASFLSFDGKVKNGFSYGSFTQIPVKLGYRFIIPFIDANFYLEPQAGISFNQRNTSPMVKGYTDNTFNYGVRGGIRWHKHWEVDLRGEAFSFNDRQYMFGGLSIGYVF